jgi:hypothetical protein
MAHCGLRRPHFNGNRIEAQFINNDRGFSFKSAGVLQVQLD